MTEYLEACERSGAYDIPQSLENRPGLDKLRQRVGTFTSFRDAMLERITRIQVKIDNTLPDGTPGNEIAPLRTWSARDSDDYGIALLALWAYVADILTFYQERIANEAYIRTAELRASLMRLAALLDYKPNPGAAASTYLIFTLKEGASARLREGLPIQHVPVSEEKPQKFETSAELVADWRWNQLTPVSDVPERVTFEYDLKSTALKGIRAKVAAGDWVLMVGSPRAPDNPLETDTSKYKPGNEKWELRQVNAVKRDEANDETIITWDNGLGSDPNCVVKPDGNLFVFRQRAALFGYNAINWNALPDKTQANLKDTNDTNGTGTGDWDNKEANSGKRIDLDREYPEIAPGSWVVLMNSSERELYRVLYVETINRSAYLMSGQVTRLFLDTDEHFESFGLVKGDPFSNVRNTVVLIQSEQLDLAKRVTVTPIAVGESSLKVSEQVDDLEPGREIMIYGPTTIDGPDGKTVPGGVKGQVVTVREVTGDGDTIQLQEPLEDNYVRAETVVYANVVEATHGETVVDEVLGNGDASIPFQTFELGQSPLTFVRQAGAPGGTASTLTLRVNDIRWREVPTFYGRRGDERLYTIDVTDDQATIIRLGNGTTGALPSSGRNNVTASYRKGVGRAGNLPARVIKTPLERPKGLKDGYNPLPSSGGVDPESLEQIREKAPNTVRTFGRIVSLQDFEDAARESIGVAKARAFVQWNGEWQTVKLIVAGEEGAEIVDTQYQALVDDLNSRRDPNRKMSVYNYCPVDVKLHVTIYWHEDYVQEIVQANIQAAIEAFFGFEQLDLGQSIALSEVYHAIHQVEGVVGAEITCFQPLLPLDNCPAAPPDPPDKSGEKLQQVVQIEPYELVRLDAGVGNLEVNMEASDS